MRNLDRENRLTEREKEIKEPETKQRISDAYKVCPMTTCAPINTIDVTTKSDTESHYIDERNTSLGFKFGREDSTL